MPPAGKNASGRQAQGLREQGCSQLKPYRNGPNSERGVMIIDLSLTIRTRAGVLTIDQLTCPHDRTGRGCKAGRFTYVGDVALRVSA